MAVTNRRPRTPIRIGKGVTLKSDNPIVRTAKLVQKEGENFKIAYSFPRGNGKGWRTKVESTHTKDPIKAQRTLDRFIDDAIELSNPTTPQDHLTVEDMCRDYVAHQPRQEGALRSIRRHLGHVRVVDLSPEWARRYVIAIGSPKANTQRRYLGALRNALNFGRKTGTLKIAPPYIPMPAVGPPRMLWLTREQLALVRDKVVENERNNPGCPKAHALTLFVFLASYFGARSEAIRDLTWDRVRWDSRVVDFNNPRKAPSKKRRATAPMNDDAYQFLREAHRQAGCPDIGKVVPVSFNTLIYAYRNFFKSIGMDWCTSHVFRHTLATHMLEDGESVYLVAKMLADSVQTIDTTYGHVLPKAAGLRQLVERRNLGWA